MPAPEQAPLPILYLIGSFRQGGAETHLVQVLEHLDRSRWEPHVACFRAGGELFSRAEARAQAIHVLKIRPPLVHVRNLGAILRLRRILQEQHIGLLHSYLAEANIVAALATRFTHVRFVASLRSVDSLKSRRLMAAHLWALRRADGILAVSQAVRRAYVARGIPEARIAVLPNGVSSRLGEVDRSSCRRALGLENGQLAVVSVGNLLPEKDYDTLLDAAALVCARDPRVRFFIGGDGPLRARLEERATRMGLPGKVKFLGYVKDVGALLSGADVFCLASIVEGMSNALLEAMAHGVPVVVTDAGSNAEVVEDQVCGQVVPMRDPERMARALLRLANDSALRREYGRRARVRVCEEFSVERMMRRLYAYYEQYQGSFPPGFRPPTLGPVRTPGSDGR